MTAGPPTAVDETTGQTPGQSPGQAMIGEIEALGDQLRRVRESIGRVIFGQQEVVERESNAISAMIDAFE